MKLRKVLDSLTPDSNVILSDMYGNHISEMYRNCILKEMIKQDKFSDNIESVGVTKVMPQTYHPQFFPTIEFFDVCLNIQIKRGE